MAFVIPQFSPALPEITAFCLGTLVLLLHAFLGDKRSGGTYFFVQLSLIITAVMTLRFIGTETIITFSGTYIVVKLLANLKF